MTKEPKSKVILTAIPFLTSLIVGNLVTLGGMTLRPETALILLVALSCTYVFFYAQNTVFQQQSSMEASQAVNQKIQQSLSDMLVWLGRPVQLLGDKTHQQEPDPFCTKARELIRDLESGDELWLQVSPRIGTFSSHLDSPLNSMLSALLRATEHNRVFYTHITPCDGFHSLHGWQQQHFEDMLELTDRHHEAHIVNAPTMLDANVLIVWKRDGTHRAILDLPVNATEGQTVGFVFLSPRHNDIIERLRHLMRRTAIAGQKIERLETSQTVSDSIIRLERVG